MADDNRFLIRTELDMKQVLKDLKLLEGKLKSLGVIKTGRATKSTGELGIQIKKMDAAATQADLKIKKLNATITTLQKRLSKTTKTGRQTNNMLLDVGRRVFIWGSLSAAIFGTLQQMKELFDFTVKVNTAMVELRKVLPRAEDFAFLKEQALQLSIEFGTGPIDVLKVVKRFAQSGLDAKESLDATRTALLGMNVTGADTERIFNAIIAANKVFGIGFENSARVIDKVQAVQANFAVDSKDLIDAITAIGPAITALGGDIDDLFGTIAGLAEAARISGKEAANSLKRVFARIVSSEGIAALQRLGVTVFATADSFRPLRDILGDLVKSLENASQAEKQNIAVVLAQVRQYPKFIALLNNYQRTIEATKISQAAFGEAFVANLDVLESYANVVARAGNVVRKFGEEIIRGGVLESFERFTVTVAEFVKEWGGFIKVVAKGAGFTILTAGALALGVAVGFVFKHVVLLTFGFDGLFAKAIKAAGGLLATSKAMQTAGVSAGFLTASMSALTLGLSAAVAITTLVFFLKDVNNESERTARVINEATNELKQFKKTLEEVNVVGVQSLNVDAKFQEIINTFKTAEAQATDGIISVDLLAEAYAKLFFGVSAGNLTNEQLKELKETLVGVQGAINNVVFKPFFTRVGEQSAGITQAFNEIQRGVEQAGFSISNFSKLVAALGGGPTQTAIFGGREFEIPDEVAIEKLGEAFKSQLAPIARYEQQIIQLENAMRGLDAQTRAQKQIDISNIEKLQQLDVDVAVQSLFELIDTQELFAQALSDTKEVTKGSLIDPGITAESRAFALVTEGLNKKLLEEAQLFAETAEESARLGKAIKDLSGFFDSLASESLFAVRFNIKAFLDSLKRTTAGVISVFKGQFKVLDQLRSADPLGAFFDFEKASITAVDNALNQLKSIIGGNEKELAKLELQIGALKGIEIKIEEEGVAFSEKGKASELSAQIVKLEQSFGQLQSTQAENNRELANQIQFLGRIKVQLLEITNARKEANALIGLQTKATEAALKKLVALNKLKFKDPFERFQANEKVFDRIVKLQKEYLQQAAKINTREAAKYALKLKELDAQTEINRLQRGLDTDLARTGEIYTTIGNNAEGISNVFADLLSNQEKFFDNLKKKSSLIAIFKDTIQAVAAEVAKADAKIISDFITKSSPLSNLFIEARNELEIIEKRIPRTVTAIINSIDTNTLIKAPLLAGANEAANKISSGIQAAAISHAALIAEAVRSGFENFQKQIREAKTAADKVLADAKAVKAAPKVTEPISKLPPALPQDIFGTIGPQSFDTFAQEFANQSVFAREEVKATTVAVEKTTASTKETTVAVKSMADILAAIDFGPGGGVSVPVPLPVFPDGPSSLAGDRARADAEAAARIAQRKQFLLALERRIVAMGAQSAAFAIANSRGVTPDTGAISSLSGLGQLVGSLGGPQGSIIGSAIGALAGGLLFGEKKQEDQTEQLRQISKNTAKMVDLMSPTLINAPAGFALPSGRGFGGAVNVTNNFTISNASSLPEDIIDTLSDQMEDIISRSTTRNSNFR